MQPGDGLGAPPSCTAALPADDGPPLMPAGAGPEMPAVAAGPAPALVAPPAALAAPAPAAAAGVDVALVPAAVGCVGPPPDPGLPLTGALTAGMADPLAAVGCEASGLDMLAPPPHALHSKQAPNTQTATPRACVTAVRKASAAILPWGLILGLLQPARLRDRAARCSSALRRSLQLQATARVCSASARLDSTRCARFYKTESCRNWDRIPGVRLNRDRPRTDGIRSTSEWARRGTVYRRTPRPGPRRCRPWTPGSTSCLCRARRSRCPRSR